MIVGDNEKDSEMSSIQKKILQEATEGIFNFKNSN